MIDSGQWNKNIIILVIMDLSAAFDTVNHNILLDVLHKCFGIEGTALDWFCNYLSSRFFKVNIGDAYSNIKELNFSVPQRSCAGPSLYNAYSGILVNCIPKEINISGFADDHSIWMNEKWLKLNAQKMKLMFMGGKQQLKKCETMVTRVIDDKVERTKIPKYLGSWLDENLSFVKHVTMKCKVAMWNIQRIRNI